MQHLVKSPEGKACFQAMYHRIKPHVPPLVRAPVNSFEFHRCRRTPQVAHLSLSLDLPIIKTGKPVSIVYGVDYQGI